MDELQEALKDLRDIHDPAPISFWPPAPGWWLVFLLIIGLGLFIRWWLKKPKTPKYKKLAIETLSNITTNYEVQRNGHKTVGELSALIRNVMVLTEGQEKIAGLVDEDWLAYLDKKSDTNIFSKGAGRVLTTVTYQKESNTDVVGLLAATKTLLKRI